MTLPLPDHGRLTDDHSVGVHPDKVVLLDRDRLLLPTLPINSHRLLTVPPPVVLSTTLNLLGLGHDGEYDVLGLPPVLFVTETRMSLPQRLDT